MKQELDSMASKTPSLITSIKRLIDADLSVSSPFRLLPFAVSGALSKDEGAALPVVVLSRIWWLGAEVFDDLTDGKFNTAEVGLSRSQAVVVSAACLSAVPSMIIKQLDVEIDFKAACEWEYADSTLAAAGSQLDDVSNGEIRSWSDVMRIYAGKSGAPYERDVALAALSAGAEGGRIRGWRVFGRLFGVLRQLANDRSCVDASEDEDLINGTWTLLLAHAMEILSPPKRAELGDLRNLARDSSAARTQVMELLGSPDVASQYNRRIMTLHSKLSHLISLLAEPTECRDTIQWMIDVSTSNAFLTVPEARI
ncbi:hypothetical protein ACFWD7_55085 [Streptomyces mirabilis]|uniref:hypothetical protein n=1 Tax=Streptomyces mirabilis TaxID=68239 RepID=UPI0036AF9C80